jgi:hypothetical protein
VGWQQPACRSLIDSIMMKISETIWRSPQGEIVACVEKLKVLRENLDEIQQLCQDALEDAVLMGCDDAQFRSVLTELVQRLENPYKER